MAGLVPCKFFLRGSCKFGETCRFYHGGLGGSGVDSANAFHQAQAHQVYPSHHTVQGFSSTVNAPSAYEEGIASIMKVIADDMREWEHSIWPFSTYGPLSLRPSIPGTEDLSDEELRYAFIANGNVFPPELNIDQRYKQTQDFRTTYSQITAASVAMIKELLALPYDAMDAPLPHFLASYQPIPQQLPSSNSAFGNSAFSPFSNSAFESKPVQSTVNTGSALSSFNFAPPLAASTTPTMDVLEGSGAGPPKAFSFSLPPTNTVSSQVSQGSSFTAFDFSKPQPTLSNTPLQPQTNSWINSFGGPNTKATPAFMSASTGAVNSQIEEEFMYSRDEDITPSDIARFEAAQFDKVPLIPPSKRFC